MTRFLTERAAFPHTAPLAGAIEYRGGDGPPATLAVLQGFVPNRGDAWAAVLEELGRWLEERRNDGPPPDAPAPARAGHRDPDHPGSAREPGGTVEEPSRSVPFADGARLLGRRTAEMHSALASAPEDPEFAPEPFTASDRADLAAGMEALARRAIARLAEALPRLSPEAVEPARQVLALEARITERLRSIRDRPLGGLRIRCHGDYHLGQVLCTPGDFLIIDFEGEPARPLAERRQKRSPLADVAGMLRSFHYASRALLRGRSAAGAEPPAGKAPAWARLWYDRVAAAFLGGYFATAAGAAFLPTAREDLDILLHAHLLEKAVYELEYELNNRPGWVTIPLEGIREAAR